MADSAHDGINAAIRSAGLRGTGIPAPEREASAAPPAPRPRLIGGPGDRGPIEHIDVTQETNNALRAAAKRVRGRAN